MPRNVRNFWISAEIDGRKSPFASGPVRKNGGVYLVIKMRDGGSVSDALRVIGTCDDAGKITLEVVDCLTGNVVHTREAVR